MSREAIEEAIEVLEEKQEPRPCKVGSACVPTENGSCACSQLTPSTNSVVTQTEQEPVAWANSFDLQNFDMKVRTGPDLHHTVPLYTAPPKREWVGLTDEEVSEIIGKEIGFNSCFGPEEAFARAIEAKLKEKNHG